MNEQDVSILMFVIFGIVLILLPVVWNTYFEPITAEDWNRHSVWVQNYIDGSLESFWEYPPLFHLFMIPFVVALGDLVKYTQIVLSVISIFAILFVTWKLENKVAVLLMTYILVTSIIFLQYAPALMPNAFDYFLFMFTGYFLLDKKYFKTTLCLTLLFYNHLSALLFFPMIFVYSFNEDKRMLKWLVLVLLLSTPVILSYHVPQIVHLYQIMSGQVDTIVGQDILNSFAETGQIFTNNWDKQFISNPLNFVMFSSVFLWILLPVSIYYWLKNKTITRTQKFYFVWFLFLLPLIFYNIWRWFSIAFIPLSLLVSSVIGNYLLKGDKNN